MSFRKFEPIADRLRSSGLGVESRYHVICQAQHSVAYIVNYYKGHDLWLNCPNWFTVIQGPVCYLMKLPVPIIEFVCSLIPEHPHSLLSAVCDADSTTLLDDFSGFIEWAPVLVQNKCMFMLHTHRRNVQTLNDLAVYWRCELHYDVVGPRRYFYHRGLLPVPLHATIMNWRVTAPTGGSNLDGEKVLV
jgi:hypothetical protein